MLFPKKHSLNIFEMLGKEKEKKSIEKSILQFEITQKVIALQNYLDYTL